MSEFLFKATILISYTYIIIFYYIVVNNRVKLASAINLFMIYQVLTFIGTLLLADVYGREFDKIRLIGMLLGTLTLTLGAFAANIVSRFVPNVVWKHHNKKPYIFDLYGGVYLWLMVGIGVFSLAVGILYVSAIGYNAPLELIRRFTQTGNLSETSLAYSQLRTAVSRGTYVAPGYANQFIRILLSLIFFLMYTRAFHTRRFMDKVVALMVFLLCVYFLTVTGVRSYIIIFSATFLVLNSNTFGPLGNLFGAKGRKFALLVILVAFVFFGLFSVLGGRVEQNATTLGNTKEVISDFLERIVFVASQNQLLVMEYFKDLPLQLGGGWVDSLRTLLPGTHLGLSNEIYFILYGNHFGNAPVDIWTSIWLEFGWAGVIIVPLIIGFLLQKLHIHFLSSGKTLSRMVIMIMVSFALIEINEPITLFNNGFVTLMIYYGLIRLVKVYERRVTSKWGKSYMNRSEQQI